MEQEKRIRREIANSNERRRMQSINAGFQSLRTLLPHHDGEKLSKAAILQHTAEYIYQLEQEKARLLSQNSQLKRLLSSQMSQDSDGSSSDSPLPKRKKGDSTDDEGIAGMSPQDTEGKEDMTREMIELRMQLDRERRLRMIVEEQVRSLEAQAYPERMRDMSHPAQQGYKTEDEVSVPCRSSPEPAAHVEAPTTVQAGHFSPRGQGSSSPTHSPAAHSEPASPTTDMPQDLSTHTAPTTVPQGDAEQRFSPCASPERVPYHASTSRQNLETIVEAIRHLEGDHLFRDDEPLRLEENSPILRNSLNVLVVQEAPSLRQQVIQPRRPGVIVTNHS
ncbi:transcription factor AP-4-like isoform X2 [Ornithodoros turicata]